MQLLNMQNFGNMLFPQMYQPVFPVVNVPAFNNNLNLMGAMNNQMNIYLIYIKSLLDLFIFVNQKKNLETNF